MSLFHRGFSSTLLTTWLLHKSREKETERDRDRERDRERQTERDREREGQDYQYWNLWKPIVSDMISKTITPKPVPVPLTC